MAESFTRFSFSNPEGTMKLPILEMIKDTIFNTVCLLKNNFFKKNKF